MLKLFSGAGTAVTSLQSNKTVVGWRKALNLDLISGKWNEFLFLKALSSYIPEDKEVKVWLFL